MRMNRAALLAMIVVMHTSLASASDSMDSVIEKVRKKYAHVAQTSTIELADWLGKKTPRAVVLLDVRQEKEYEVSHLRNAKRALTLEEALDQLGDASKDTLIVAYCSVGYRSSELVERLTESGYTSVHNLEGSIFKWANEGRAVYRGDERVHCVHPYNRWWGRLLNDKLHDCPAEDPHSE